MGWGLLVREGDRLELQTRPEWRDADEATRLTFLHRIAAAGSKATNREAGVDYLAIESERRGMNLVRTPRTIGVAITATARRPLSVGSAKRQ